MDIVIHSMDELAEIHAAMEGRIEVLEENDKAAEAKRWDACFDTLCKVPALPMVVSVPKDIGEYLVQHLKEVDE
jgi:hypothetical protein